MPRTQMKARSLFGHDDDPPEVKVAETTQNPYLVVIDEQSANCEARYQGKLLQTDTLSRSLVSFQANKERPFYRWFKYKEAFSAGLVEHLLSECGVTGGTLFDPFAGIGTALFAAGEMGLRSEGIELLPIGQQVIKTKQLIDADLKASDIKVFTRWLNDRPWHDFPDEHPITKLRNRSRYRLGGNSDASKN